jgi:membrane-associated phospholipid phosphatase
VNGMRLRSARPRQRPGQPSGRSSSRPAARPLLAARARPWAVGLLAGSAILVAVLGVLFARHTVADPFDRAVDAPVIAWFRARQLFAFRLAYPGTLIPAVVLSAAIAVGCLLTGRRNGAVLAVTAVPAATGLCEALLKPLVHRTYLGQVTYPSGHTATVFALAATVVVLLLAPPSAGARVPRMLISAVACVVGLVVVVAVIGLRYHYFTDAVAGAAVGIGTVCGLALVLDLPAVRRWLRIA